MLFSSTHCNKQISWLIPGDFKILVKGARQFDTAEEQEDLLPKAVLLPVLCLQELPLWVMVIKPEIVKPLNSNEAG